MALHNPARPVTTNCLHAEYHSYSSSNSVAIQYCYLVSGGHRKVLRATLGMETMKHCCGRDSGDPGSFASLEASNKPGESSLFDMVCNLWYGKLEVLRSLKPIRARRVHGSRATIIAYFNKEKDLRKGKNADRTSDIVPCHSFPGTSHTGANNHSLKRRLLL